MVCVRRVLGVSVLASATFLSGCGSFFVCQKASCPASGTTTNTGDFVYVSNSTSGSTYIAGYSITSGALTAISGAAVDLGYVPVAMNVSPLNTFLYVASQPGATTPGVYLYAISSTGALTAANNGDPVVSDDTIASMDISPDGNYLFTVGTSLELGVVLTEYPLDTSTGAISGPATVVATGGTSCTIAGSPLSQQCTVKVSPSGDYVGVAEGLSGAIVYPYSSSKGLTSTTGQYVAALNAQSGDFSLAFDKNNYMYVASTLALSSYGGLGGTAAPTLGTTQAFNTGVTPRSVTLSTSYSYVYTANEGASTISGFGLSGAGVLTPVATAAVSGPTNVSALGADNSGMYLIAAGYNVTNGLQLYNITSTGTLTTASSFEGTGNDLTVPVVMALSH